MSDDSNLAAADGADPADTVAMVLRHLCWVPPGTKLVSTPIDRLMVQRVAMDWQTMGMYAPIAEMHGARQGALQDRMSELMGRAAAAGEQLGLAWTLDQELQRWHAADSDSHPGRSMATRALAETCGYYLLGAAHGLGNLTARTLVLSNAAGAVLNTRRPRANRFPPFSAEREAWPPLNRKLADHLVEAALATGDAAAIALCEVVVGLLDDHRWEALVQRRDVDYHRWRPQGLPSGGVPQRTLWDNAGTANRSLSFGGTFYEPVDHDDLCLTPGEAMEALGTAMDAWSDRWPAALAAVGVAVFNVAP